MNSYGDVKSNTNRLGNAGFEQSTSKVRINNTTNNDTKAPTNEDTGQDTSNAPTQSPGNITNNNNDNNDTKMPAASDVTPRSTNDFIVKPPIYVKGVPVADNIKNRLLIQEIDREAKLQEKIEKTHAVDKFFPYQPPVLGQSHGQKKPPYSQDKSAHNKQHQHELHEWHKVQKQREKRLNEEHKQQHGIHEGRKLDRRVQRAPPTQEVGRFKEKTHTKRWVSKRKHVRDNTEKTQ